jgi:DNA-binding NarL/FixJ family response regulator
VSKSINPNSFWHKELEVTPFQIVGEFCIKSVHFLIITDISDREANATNLEESKTSLLSFFSNRLQATVMGQFELDGNFYLIVKTQNLVQDTAAEPSPIDLLTERELQVATLTASGRSNKQIATHLQISEWTVSAHLRRIFIKLNVDNRAAMAYRCAPLIHQAIQMARQEYGLAQID